VRQPVSVRLRYKERMNVESTFQPAPASGLDREEAAARLKQFGSNELPRAKRRDAEDAGNGAVVASCMLIPGLQRLFQFEVPSAGLVCVAMLLGVGSALLFDLAKLSTSVQRILGRVASTKTLQPGEAS